MVEYKFPIFIFYEGLFGHQNDRIHIFLACNKSFLAQSANSNSKIEMVEFFFFPDFNTIILSLASIILDTKIFFPYNVNDYRHCIGTV